MAREPLSDLKNWYAYYVDGEFHHSKKTRSPHWSDIPFKVAARAATITAVPHDNLHETYFLKCRQGIPGVHIDDIPRQSDERKNPMSYDTYEAPLYQCHTARLEWTADGLTAYYVDGARIMDELTVVIREREEVTEDGRTYVFPEETDIWQEEFDAYRDALVTWVASITGVSVDTLRDSDHPDLNEPWIQIRNQ